MSEMRCGLCAYFSDLVSGLGGEQADAGLCAWFDTHDIPFWMHPRTPLWVDVQATDGTMCDAFRVRDERESNP